MTKDEIFKILERARNEARDKYRADNSVWHGPGSGCQYFLTTDDKIMNRNLLIEEITIIDPIGHFLSKQKL